jgi:hypothetical protein
MLVAKVARRMAVMTNQADLPAIILRMLPIPHFFIGGRWMMCSYEIAALQ